MIDKPVNRPPPAEAFLTILMGFKWLRKKDHYIKMAIAFFAMFPAEQTAHSVVLNDQMLREKTQTKSIT